jgi:hypothetical protein
VPSALTIAASEPCPASPTAVDTLLAYTWDCAEHPGFDAALQDYCGAAVAAVRESVLQQMFPASIITPAAGASRATVEVLPPSASPSDDSGAASDGEASSQPRARLIDLLTTAVKVTKRVSVVDAAERCAVPPFFDK